MRYFALDLDFFHVFWFVLQKKLFSQRLVEMVHNRIKITYSAIN